MNGGDIAAVAAIEETAVSPWNKRQIADEIQRSHGLSLVAVSADDDVHAWCCGLQMADDAELLKITVNPEKQRTGLGNSLLHDFCVFYENKGMSQIFLEVRSQNFAALALYEKQGFQAIGRRKNYYTKPVDDAIVYVRRLNND